MAGIYVHIPFCVSRCAYCAFCSTTHLSLRDRYIEAVAKEYGMRQAYLAHEPIETIYLGGGTPSVLTPDNLNLLFEILPLRADIAEVTMECNPDDISPTLVSQMKALGINRVSMGVQTFDDARLRFLHRRHTAQQAREAIGILRQGGIENVSIDLIFGFPSQTIDEWNDDIRQALALDVEHISAYSLTYEEGTPLNDLLRKGQIRDIGEEESREMYYLLLDRLAEGGFEQYEISNFARRGYRAKHNSNYWRDVAYIGLGAAAHSYDHLSRQWNTEDITAYIDAIEHDCLPYEREDLTDDMRYNDMITTALRTKDGINLKDNFHNKDYLLTSAQPFLNRHLLAIDGNNSLHLTRQALFIADSILAELVKV